MNTSKEEFLSALLDDEAGEFERRRLLNELKKDDELGQTLSRYALIGETMRAGRGQRISQGASLLTRIQDELADEPTYGASVVEMPVDRPVVNRSGWGVAIAATIAAVAMGGMLFLQSPDRDGMHTVAVTTTVPGQAQTVVALPAAETVAVAVTMEVDTDTRIRQVGRIDSQTRDILKQYVAQHVKYASTTAIAPSIRAVSYGNEH
ncbi:MAG: sigma-E factor negative regulatory protein [Gammaproteobacteria bacterium]|nr:sigma-E factor negative regulatory protein [Gammaproteobacteria bacterium]MBU1724409.1 sigma-E factor negative regulatory protein [Gammaproteobacteria bacterium]MBU2004372.1 sigma-E factor negative regulatory protein [Gammaproteobacteria bacterium]